MPTMYTPLTDGQYGRAATFNAPLQEMETAILARYGVLRTVQAWTTLTADAASISPTIAAGYNTIQLMMALRSNNAADNDSLRITINNDVSSTYVWRYLMVNAAATPTGSSGVTGFVLANCATGATSTSGAYAYVNMRFSLASTAAAKMGNYESVHQATVGTVPNAAWGSLLYPTSAIISSLQIYPNSGTAFVAGSSYAVYGMS